MFAYILLITKPLFEHDIYYALYKAEEISEVYPLFGEYDIICKINAVDREAIQKVVEEKIKSIDGVLCTKTLMGIITIA